MVTTSGSACINCGADVSTAYCAACGQKHPPKKLNVLTLYTDFQSRIYGFDGMFPRTVRDLTVNPGLVARAFIQGNRVKYVGPVGYFFLGITFYLLFMELFGLTLADLSLSAGEPAGTVSGREALLREKFMALMSGNLRLFSFAVIPFTGATALLLFRRERYNILEHSVLVFYTSGHVVWISLLNLFVIAISGFNGGAVLLIGGIFYYAFACATFYQSRRKRSAFFRGLLVSAIAHVLYLIFIVAIAMIYFLNDPAIRNAAKNSGG